MILLDDLGFSDLGCFGGEIETPNVDALAAGGLRFTNYTTVPMCTPARAALLTGKNPHSVGCGWLSHHDPGYPGYKGEMSLDAPTMAEILRSTGYSTMAVGKWHNTYDRNNFPGGDTSSWPLQRGFDRFYGFMSAETSYFQPDNMLDGNQFAGVESYPDDYFAPDDYTRRAIGWMAEHRSCSPDKPFFLYLAFQTPHGPLQAKPGDLKKYLGRYDAGWDALRMARYQRQRAEAVIEPNAAYPERNPGVAAWADLPPEDRALYARYMEVYAALVDNADQNIGKVLDFLRRTGQLDNTIVMVTSDNGANSVGGPTGAMNLQARRAGLPDNPEVNRQLLEAGRVGSKETYVVYPSGWTQVSNTPYRLYKRTPMAGGIRVPFVVHWPSGIAREERGAIRRQWIHVTDVLPTVMDLAQTALPPVFNGFRTRDLDGKSFTASLRSGTAPSQRSRQYYELQANRGYISGDWKIVSLQVPAQRLDLDNWMLFNIADDPTEIHDLADQHPEILDRMVAEFESEATANYVYPLDNRDERRLVSLPPYELDHVRLPRDFHREGQAIPGAVISPLIGDRCFVLRASFDWNTGDEGVILSIGDRFSGMVLYVEQDALHFTYQWWFSPRTLPPIRLKPGKQEFELDFKATGGRRGEAAVTLNGALHVERAELSPTMLRATNGLSVGMSRRLSVSECHEGKGALRYTGQIDRVRIEPGELASDSPIVSSEALIQARMRDAGLKGSAV